MKFKFDFKRKLYLITDEKLISRKNFIEKIKEAAKSGIKIIQIREKKSKLHDRVELIKKVVETARELKIKIIINDDPYLAKEVNADGVHLGKNDYSIKLARSILGEDAIIGISCYGSVELAEKMEKEGADYVSFGNFFLSPTKPDEKIIPLNTLKKAKEKLKIPVIAIGGINHKNAKKVFESGADSIAVVSDILARNNIKEAVRNYLKKKLIEL